MALCNHRNNAVSSPANLFIDPLVLCKTIASIHRCTIILRANSTGHVPDAGVYTKMGMLGLAGEMSSIDSINASLVF